MYDFASLHIFCFSFICWSLARMSSLSDGRVFTFGIRVQMVLPKRIYGGDFLLVGRGVAQYIYLVQQRGFLLLRTMCATPFGSVS